MSEADGTTEQVCALYKPQQDDFPHYALNRWMITPPQNNLVGVTRKPGEQLVNLMFRGLRSTCYYSASVNENPTETVHGKFMYGQPYKSAHNFKRHMLPLPGRSLSALPQGNLQSFGHNPEASPS